MLMICWNGTPEAHGECPGLSSYLGPSQLAPAIDTQDSTASEPTLRGKCLNHRGGDHVPRGTYDALIAGHLQRRLSYRWIARRFGVSVSVVRRVAKALARG